MRYVLGFMLFLMGHEALGANCHSQKVCCYGPYPVNPCKPWWSKGWAATVYSGPLTSQTSSKIIQNADFGKSGIIALAVSKWLGRPWNKPLDFELESQAVQHFGEQKHFEINPIALVARWSAFPWNRNLPTTVAIGDGLSIATEKPKLEVKRRGHKKSTKTLNYVMAEITFSPPCHRQWAFVLRYHHRSGMFGTFHGVEDASTVLAAGVKYWF